MKHLHLIEKRKKRILLTLLLTCAFVQNMYSQYWINFGETARLYTGEYTTMQVSAPFTGAIIDAYAFTNNSGYVEIHGDNAIVNGYFTGTATIKCTYSYHYYSGTTRINKTGQVGYFFIEAKAVNISLNKSNLSLMPNEESQLFYTVLQSDAPSPEIKWESSDETVAIVTDGLVRAKNIGSAKITAINNAGPSVSCNVIVNRIDPISVSLPSYATVEAKKTITLTPVLEPSDAHADFSWVSSDNAVAIVDNGTVTGMKSGRATIKVTTHNNLSTTCEVEVLPEKLSITSNVESGIVAVGTTITLSASVPAAKIYYTLDGTAPTQESLLYTEPIRIFQSLTLKAKAFLNDYGDSEVLTREFIVTTLPAKTVYPIQGTQIGSGNVVPCITFYEKIAEGESFEKIRLMKGNSSVEGTPLIKDSELYFVPNCKLEDGNYQLLVPSNAINASVSDKSHNEPITIDFSVGKTISGDLTPIISSKDHTLVVKTDGSLWAWGNNSDGQIGDGTKTTRYSPVKVLDNVVYATTGQYHSMAIRTDGSLWTWGDNDNGELGDGTTEQRLSPIKVLDDVIAIAAGQAYSMAIKTDGSLWAWGYNGKGQIGDGTKTSRNTPVKVLDNVSSISTNSFHSMALKEDGSLWTWGNNNFGQLGNETTTECNLPKKILNNVVAISAGYDFSMALKTDGSLWTWGYNYFGQLGNGATTDRHTPVNVMSNVKAISAGLMHCMAIKNDGSLWTWGYNGSGELGDGTTTDRHSPKKIMNNVCQIAAGNSRSMAIKEDGSLWEWGVIKYHYQMKVIQGRLVYLDEKSRTPVKLFDNMDNEIELPLISNMSIDEQINIIEGRKTLIIPNLDPTDADYESMEWTSDDESIATVSPRGIVTGVAPGEATLTVKVVSKEGIEFTADCKVTVTEDILIGDVNGDKRVSISDVSVLRNYLLGNNPEKYHEKAADINGDGRVSISDVGKLVNQLLNKK